jgi:AcrR family transcriptional regulator
MNHMVQSAMGTSQARERLLAAAVEQATRGGITDLSMRELAAAIGTSHRMLLYHFGSREGLMVAISDEVNKSVRAAMGGWSDLSADARKLWQDLTDPAAWPIERLYFELYAHALLGRPGTEGFLEGAVEPWITASAGLLVGSGADPDWARAEARLGLAIVRGLLLDLLATGDRAGVSEAYEHFLGPALARLTGTAGQVEREPLLADAGPPGQGLAQAGTDEADPAVEA